MKSRSRRTRSKSGNRSPRTRIRPRAIIVVCVLGAFLIAGTFFAAQQHFYFMDYGMKNSRLKRQIDELEAEKRRLLLAREVALSPAELKRTARRLGVVNSSASADEAVKVSSVVKEKANPPKPTNADEVSTEANPFVVKTAASVPTDGETRPRKTAAKPEKERSEARPRTVN